MSPSFAEPGAFVPFRTGVGDSVPLLVSNPVPVLTSLSPAAPAPPPSPPAEDALPPAPEGLQRVAEGRLPKAGELVMLTAAAIRDYDEDGLDWSTPENALTPDGVGEVQRVYAGTGEDEGIWLVEVQGRVDGGIRRGDYPSTDLAVVVTDAASCVVTGPHGPRHTGTIHSNPRRPDHCRPCDGVCKLPYSRFPPGSQCMCDQCGRACFKSGAPADSAMLDSGRRGSRGPSAEPTPPRRRSPTPARRSPSPPGPPAFMRPTSTWARRHRQRAVFGSRVVAEDAEGGVSAAGWVLPAGEEGVVIAVDGADVRVRYLSRDSKYLPAELFRVTDGPRGSTLQIDPFTRLPMVRDCDGAFALARGAPPPPVGRTRSVRPDWNSSPVADPLARMRAETSRLARELDRQPAPRPPAARRSRSAPVHGAATGDGKIFERLYQQAAAIRSRKRDPSRNNTTSGEVVSGFFTHFRDAQARDRRASVDATWRTTGGGRAWEPAPLVTSKPKSPASKPKNHVHVPEGSDDSPWNRLHKQAGQRKKSLDALADQQRQTAQAAANADVHQKAYQLAGSTFPQGRQRQAMAAAARRSKTAKADPDGWKRLLQHPSATLEGRQRAQALREKKSREYEKVRGADGWRAGNPEMQAWTLVGSTFGSKSTRENKAKLAAAVARRDRSVGRGAAAEVPAWERLYNARGAGRIPKLSTPPTGPAVAPPRSRSAPAPRARAEAHAGAPDPSAHSRTWDSSLPEPPLLHSGSQQARVLSGLGEVVHLDPRRPSVDDGATLVSVVPPGTDPLVLSGDDRLVLSGSDIAGSQSR